MYQYGIKVFLLLALGLLMSTFCVGIAKAQTLTTLHTFNFNDSNGVIPIGLVQGSDGKLYGTTNGAGIENFGTVFKITLNGKLTLLHSFGSSGPDGAWPSSGLIQGSDGNFYGTTGYGGDANAGPSGYGGGIVYKITPDGTETVLHLFGATSNSDGATPAAGLIQGTDGNFYGTTLWGGSYDKDGTDIYGTVYKITPDGTETVLYSFGDFLSGDGYQPFGGLIQGTDGNFYGTTVEGGLYRYGTVFKISPDGTVYNTLHNFDSIDGAYPYASLIQGTDGNFYGTTNGGIGTGYGTVFKITPSGALTTLYSFSGSDGANPLAGLIQANDGNFYGTTQYGGMYNLGTIYQITPAGSETVLYSFTGGADGGFPEASLIQGKDGNLYGTTDYTRNPNNPNNAGTVFKFILPNPVPVIMSLSPNSTDAGGPAFPLIVKGSNFASNSILNWNGSPLTTTFVSATKLTATVPASLIANPGIVNITVTTPAAGTSVAKKFTIPVTTLKLTSATLSKDSTSYTANINLTNIGYVMAPNVTITRSTLGAWTRTIPVTVGSIAAGAAGTASLAFPLSSGTSGSIVTLAVSGTYSGGTFKGSLKVTLP